MKDKNKGKEKLNLTGGDGKPHAANTSYKSFAFFCLFLIG